MFAFICVFKCVCECVSEHGCVFVCVCTGRSIQVNEEANITISTEVNRESKDTENGMEKIYL